MKLMTLQVNDINKVKEMGDVVRREVYKSINDY